MAKDQEKDIDWKETDWLVTQLRAKLEEDEAKENASPEAPPSPPADRKSRKKQEKKAAPAAVTEPSPVSASLTSDKVEEKNEETAEKSDEVEKETPKKEEKAQKVESEEEPKPEQKPEPEKKTAFVPSTSFFRAEGEAEPAAPAPKPAPKAAPKKTKGRVGRPPRIINTKPSIKPIGADTVPPIAPLNAKQEAKPLPAEEKPMPVAAEKPVLTAEKPAAPQAAASEKPAPQRRTAEEKSAEITVEHLMHDLFGAPAASAWPTAVPQPLTPAVADQKAKTEDPETITRDRDGQIALVLPETGKPLALTGERESAGGRREKNAPKDEDQIDLFDPDVVASTMETDPVKEAAEFKRFVESSPEDFRMLLELDYENELGTAIGFEKIRSYHEEGVNGRAVTQKRRRRITPDTEYEVQSQDTALRKNYNKQKKEHILRLVLSLAVTLLLFVYERTDWMAKLFGGPFDGAKYPAAYILIGLQLLVIAAYFSWRRLLEGFWRMVRFSPIDYSLCSVVLIATFLYHVILILLPHTAAPSLYLSPAALVLALVALADLLDWYRESIAFQVVSSRRQKYALIPRVSVGGKQGDAKERLHDSHADGQVWYLRPVGFVRNYFANTNRRIEHGRSLGVQILLVLAIGLSLGLYVFAAGGDMAALLETAFVTFLLCVPVTSLLVTSLPMFLASCLRLGKKGAIIGEGPVYECGGPTTLVMPDGEVFGAMHHERFEVVDEAREEYTVRLVRALLEKLQSPLADSVSVERDRRISPSLVELTEIEAGGVTALVGNDRVPMMMGYASYLEERGVHIPTHAVVQSEQSGRRLLCVTVKGEVAAIFLARYRLNQDMSVLLRELEAEGVGMMVRTKDPGIRDDLFEELLPDSKERIKVMKPTAREMDLRTDRVDATVVALGSCREAARTFVTCRRVRRAGSLGKIFQGLSVGCGALLAGLLTLLTGHIAVSAFLVSVYLLLWCGVHALTSFLYLREHKEDKS